MYKLKYLNTERKLDFLFLFLVSAANNQCTFTCLTTDFIKVEPSRTIERETIFENILRIVNNIGEYQGYEEILLDPEMKKWIEKSK